MVRGLYTGASGMVAQQHRMDALANNLANVDLTGYKRDTSVSKAFPELLIRRLNDDGLQSFPLGSFDTAPIVGKMGSGVEYNETFTVFEQGSLKETGNPFDLALEGSGFFVIETPQGERYTRNGSFLMNNEGFLVTKEGHYVLGENGRIQVKANNFVIDREGRIFENAVYGGNPEELVALIENEWEETELLDSLQIVDFHRGRYLQKQGNSLWRATIESGTSIDRTGATQIVQGFLEGSNVNPVTEMIRMIEVNRAYEANQKSIQTHDALTGRLLNEVLRA